MSGAAEEVATVFISTLSRAIAKAPAPVKASPPYPNRTSPGECASDALKAAAFPDKVRQLIDSWESELGNMFK